MHYCGMEDDHIARLNAERDDVILFALGLVRRDAGQVIARIKRFRFILGVEGGAVVERALVRPANELERAFSGDGFE